MTTPPQQPQQEAPEPGPSHSRSSDTTNPLKRKREDWQFKQAKRILLNNSGDRSQLQQAGRRLNTDQHVAFKNEAQDRLEVAASAAAARKEVEGDLIMNDPEKKAAHLAAARREVEARIRATRQQTGNTRDDDRAR